MIEREDVIRIIEACIDESNETRSPDEQLEKDPEAVLHGEGSQLDSLALIILATTLEDACERELGIQVSLIAEISANDVGASPMASIEVLATWIQAASA